MAAGFEDEITGRQRTGCDAPDRASVHAPHDGRDPGQEFRLAERLGQVVVGAQAERANLGRLAAFARNDQDRGLTDGSHLPGHAEPVGTRHGQVQQDEVRIFLAETFDGGQTVVRGDDLVTLRSDKGRDRSDHRRIVVDDEDPEASAAHADHRPRSIRWPRRLAGR
ncbi:MAG: hypothetical protein WKF56_05030 [Candidatus Limnocylindrales bacterium]